MLKQFGRAKEQRRRLLRAERLPDIEEEHDPGEQCPASSWTDGRVVEDACLLDDGGLVVVVGAETTLFVLFGCQRHGIESWTQAVNERDVVDTSYVRDRPL